MKTKKKSKANKRTALTILLLVTIGAIIALGAYQNKGQPTQKEPASKYFEIIEPTVNDGEFREPTIEEGGDYNISKVLVIYSISFNVSARGGDATNVVVYGWGDAEPVELGTILKNQSASVELQSSHETGYFSRLVDGKGYPFEFEMRSEEAKGEILIYL